MNGFSRLHCHNSACSGHWHREPHHRVTENGIGCNPNCSRKEMTPHYLRSERTRKQVHRHQQSTFNRMSILLTLGCGLSINKNEGKRNNCSFHKVAVKMGWAGSTKSQNCMSKVGQDGGEKSSNQRKGDENESCGEKRTGKEILETTNFIAAESGNGSKVKRKQQTIWGGGGGTELGMDCNHPRFGAEQKALDLLQIRALLRPPSTPQSLSCHFRMRVQSGPQRVPPFL
jgi:hypothetical protein